LWLIRSLIAMLHEQRCGAIYARCCRALASNRSPRETPVLGIARQTSQKPQASIRWGPNDDSKKRAQCATEISGLAYQRGQMWKQHAISAVHASIEQAHLLEIFWRSHNIILFGVIDLSRFPLCTTSYLLCTLPNVHSCGFSPDWPRYGDKGRTLR
jgi:hypothetical protein